MAATCYDIDVDTDERDGVNDDDLTKRGRLPSTRRHTVSFLHRMDHHHHHRNGRHHVGHNQRHPRPTPPPPPTPHRHRPSRRWTIWSPTVSSKSSFLLWRPRRHHPSGDGRRRYCRSSRLSFVSRLSRTLVATSSSSASLSTDSLPSDGDGDGDVDHLHNDENNVGVVVPRASVREDDGPRDDHDDNDDCSPRNDDDNNGNSIRPAMPMNNAPKPSQPVNVGKERKLYHHPFMIALEGNYSAPCLLQYDTEEEGGGDEDEEEEDGNNHLHCTTHRTRPSSCQGGSVQHDNVDLVNDVDSDSGSGTDDDRSQDGIPPHRYRRPVSPEGDEEDDAAETAAAAAGGTVGTKFDPSMLTPELLEYHLESVIPERISLMAMSETAFNTTDRAREIANKIYQIRKRLKPQRDGSDRDLLSTCSVSSLVGHTGGGNGSYRQNNLWSNCIILILHPTKRAFDLVPVDYQVDVSTVHDLLLQIPERVSKSADYTLRFQRYQGLAVMNRSDGNETLLGVSHAKDQKKRKKKSHKKKKKTTTETCDGQDVPSSDVDVDKDCDGDGDNDTADATAEPSTAFTSSQTIVPWQFCLDYHIEQEAPLVAIPDTFSVPHTLALARMLMKDSNVQRSFQEMQEFILSGLDF